MFEDDIIPAFKRYQAWLYLSWFDIKQRYKRSTLGPFWVTISTGILIGMLSILWSTLFKLDVKDYVPFFSIGQVVWTFIAMQLTDASMGFGQFDYIIRQSKVSFTSFILRLISRNLIIFAHNFVIVFFVITFVSGSGWSFTALFSILGLLILSIALSGFSLLLTIICTRFRDVQMIVQNFLMVAFYFTPIMWKTDQLSENVKFYVNFNPIVHYMSIIRDPLLGIPPSLLSWIVSIIVAIFFIILSLVVLNKYRNRIAYWL
ncbi:ABC transporter permease [Plesiomonas shigelloides]|uniref:ABC transporter permease n=1 Tax=Plesiomonas shigelloides TaxID=703 RepID=UPI00057AC37F|nr:ABC transporter permease [Plesiomonas shigelloides]